MFGGTCSHIHGTYRVVTHKGHLQGVYEGSYGVHTGYSCHNSLRMTFLLQESYVWSNFFFLDIRNLITVRWCHDFLPRSASQPPCSPSGTWTAASMVPREAGVFFETGGTWGSTWTRRTSGHGKERIAAVVFCKNNSCWIKPFLFFSR